MSDPGDLTALVLRVGSTVCALPSLHAIETMRPLPITPLDNMPPFTLGVATIRGAATPVIDLAALLGQLSAPPARLVTVRTGGRVAALAVDAVLGLMRFDRDRFAARPSILGGDARPPIVTSLATKDDAVYLVLDAARFLDDAEVARE